MRYSIRDPITEIFAGCEALSTAADARLFGERKLSEAALRRADCSFVWAWLNPAWINVNQRVVDLRPEVDTQSTPKI